MVFFSDAVSNRLSVNMNVNQLMGFERPALSTSVMKVMIIFFPHRQPIVALLQQGIITSGQNGLFSTLMKPTTALEEEAHYGIRW